MIWHENADGTDRSQLNDADDDARDGDGGYPMPAWRAWSQVWDLRAYAARDKAQRGCNLL